MSEWIEKAYTNIITKIENEALRNADKIPYKTINDKYTDESKSNISWWTNGFWAGILWQMYYCTKKEKFALIAKTTEDLLDNAFDQFLDLHHDVGLMWLHSTAASYRLTDDKRSLQRALHAATLLAGRFNAQGKFIRAWNGEHRSSIIIDCLMNIPLLYWASRQTEDPRFKYIANFQAQKALEVLARPDGSVHHIAILDVETGEPVEFPVGQGYSGGSSWSRGQSWAIYGFALAYSNTNNEDFLNASKRAANYFIVNIAETAYIPKVDFKAPDEPQLIDVSAGCIAACGMLELASHLKGQEQEIYRNSAVKILKAVYEKHCDWNFENDGIINNSTVAYFGDEGTHIKLIYADYFFIEAIFRLKGKYFNIW